MVGFRAAGHITEEDYKQTVVPQVEQLLAKTGQINYLLLLDTPVSEFTLGAWWQDALLGLQHLRKWNRAAIVTDSDSIIWFTDAFSKVMLGEFKGFHKDQLADAIAWASGK